MLTSPAEPLLLRSLGEVSSECEQRGADFLFVGRDGLVAVQRKEVKDLDASLRDGRLARELGQAAESGVIKMVIVVEGDPDLCMLRASFDGIMLSLQVEYGWTVMRTDTVAETADLLRRMETWFTKNRHGSLEVRPKGNYGTPGSAAWRRHVWMTFPGVSAGRAALLDKHFKGELPLRFTCTMDELLACPKVGKKTAQKIYDALGRDGDS